MQANLPAKYLSTAKAHGEGKISPLPLADYF
jgi:hypothetical protein